MDLDRIVNGAAHFGCQLFIYGSLGFCAGHTCAFLSSAAKSATTAKIFAIASLVFLTFREAVEFHISELEERNVVYILGVFVGGTALAQVLKQAEIISHATSLVFFSSVAFLTIAGLTFHRQQFYFYS